LLIYLKEINPITATNAGYYAGLVMLLAQISDAVSTPTVGFFSDKVNTRLGKRKPWYLLGWILTTFSFIFIFI